MHPSEVDFSKALIRITNQADRRPLLHSATLTKCLWSGSNILYYFYDLFYYSMSYWRHSV